MARGRMIDKRVGKSKKLGKASDKAKVLWFMIYPHLDVAGRIAFDDLDDLRVEIIPYFKNWPLKKIADSLNELADIDLIWLYPNDNKIAMEFKKFENFQIGLRKDREAPSEISPPGESPENSGSFRISPALRLRLKLNIKEGRKEGNNKKGDDFEKEFEKLQEIWPRKEDMGKAKEKYFHLVMIKKIDPQRIMNAATGYLRCEKSKGTDKWYIKHLKTFLYAGSEKRKIPPTFEQYEQYADPKYKIKPSL